MSWRNSKDNCTEETLAHWTLNFFRDRRSLYIYRNRKAGIQQLPDVFLWWTSSRSGGVPHFWCVSSERVGLVFNYSCLYTLILEPLEAGRNNWELFATSESSVKYNRSQAKSIDLMVCLLLSWDTSIQRRPLRLCIETILQALDLYFPCSDTRLEWMSWVINMPWGRCRQGVMDNDKDIICKRWCSANGKLVVRVGGVGLKPPTQTTKWPLVEM